MLQPDIVPFNENVEAKEIRERQEAGWVCFTIIFFTLGTLLFIFAGFAFLYKNAGWKLMQNDHKVNDMATLMVEYAVLWICSVTVTMLSPICYTTQPYSVVYIVICFFVLFFSFLCLIQIDYEFYILMTDREEREHYEDVAGILFLHASIIFGAWFAFWSICAVACCPCIICTMQLRYINANYAGRPTADKPLLADYPPHA